MNKNEIILSLALVFGVGLIIGAWLMKLWVLRQLERASSVTPRVCFDAVGKLARAGLGLAFLKALRAAHGHRL